METEQTAAYEYQMSTSTCYKHAPMPLLGPHNPT